MPPDTLVSIKANDVECYLALTYEHWLSVSGDADLQVDEFVVYVDIPVAAQKSFLPIFVEADRKTFRGAGLSDFLLLTLDEANLRYAIEVGIFVHRHERAEGLCSCHGE